MGCRLQITGYGLQVLEPLCKGLPGKNGIQEQSTYPDFMYLYWINKNLKLMKFTISSNAFDHGGLIPIKYTCDGENISPPLTWVGNPGMTVSYALICYDPDAPMGTWIHWVLYNVPSESTHLPEGFDGDKKAPRGVAQGLNSWNRLGYGGPCPPRGVHRYFFRLYALDCRLNAPSGLTESGLKKSMEDHILAEALIMGRYGR